MVICLHKKTVANSGYKQKACHNFCIASGQLHHDTKLIVHLPVLETVMAKIAPWCLARRDTFLAKVPGQLAGVTAPPTLSAHTRNR
jgi:hypothetical protein